MAELGTVLTNLREEVTQEIYQVSPEAIPHKAKADGRWQVFEATQDGAAEFEETTGHMRLFEVAWVGPIVQETLGGNDVRKYSIGGLIRVHYPDGDLYRVAAMADADKIRRRLNDNATATTGCDFREVPEFDEVIMTETGDGDGLLLNVPLLAVVETTG